MRWRRDDTEFQQYSASAGFLLLRHAVAHVVDIGALDLHTIPGFTSFNTIIRSVGCLGGDGGFPNAHLTSACAVRVHVC